MAVPLKTKGYPMQSIPSDTVRKQLLVKPGCERFEITENIYASGKM